MAKSTTPSTTKQAVAGFFLGNSSVASSAIVASKVAGSTGTTLKTVRNVLSILVAAGALKRAENGYAARNKRKLASVAA